MWRKLFFITSFVLVLALCGVGRADSIDINNPSFEYAPDGNRVPSTSGAQGAGGLAGVMAWTAGGNGWIGIDVMCTYVIGADPMRCHRWPGPTDPCGTGTDVVYPYMQNSDGTNCYQVLDMNNSDANAVIQVGRRYTLTWDALVAETYNNGNKVKGILFYVEDPCFPDVHTVVASRERAVWYIERPPESSYCKGTSMWDDETVCQDWNYDLKLNFVAEASQTYLGETLGIKFQAVGDIEENFSFVDNVRLDWQYATQAYAPNPDDGAVEVPKDVNIVWSPGMWAKAVNGHDVYFGSTWAEVNSATTDSNEFKGIQSPNSFDPTPGANVLTLGDSYYWRIDEVNKDYNSPPGPVPYPPGGKFKGEIWSFTVKGRAKNPHPADKAADVPKNVILRWTRGAESLYHDVYFGSTDAEVTAATTGSGEYKTQLNKGTELYDAGTNENPEVGEQYFWRIDEVNSITVKGNTWDFTVANWILIDDFDFYANHNALRQVWQDWLSGHSSNSEVWVNLDPNWVVDGNSMLFKYFNNTSPKYSETMRTYATGQDWSYAGNGVTALEIDFFGDVNSVPDPPMYVKLSDGSTTVQVNPGPNDVTNESVQTWFIPLKDFNDGGVTLSNITAITLGIGDKVGEGGPPIENGTLYFDDIRLYPPRCMVEYTSVADFTGDCSVDNNDLDVVATDWLLTDGNTPTETRNGTLTDFPTDDSQWVAGHIGPKALEFDGVDDYVHVTDPRLKGLTSISITAWVKQTVDNEWEGIVTSREEVDCRNDESAEIGIYGGAYGGPDGLGYDWPCYDGDPWKFDAGLDVPEDGTWTFVALVVEPTSATLYMRPDGGVLDSGTNTATHPMLDTFGEYFDLGRTRPGSAGRFQGAIDDVRIYGYNLSFADVNALAYQAADPNPWPVYHYKLDETSGLVAADSGSPIEVYGAVQSKANLTDPEPKFERSVNFKDYVIFADDWLGDFEYPQP